MSAGFAGATGKKYSFIGHGNIARKVKLGKPGHCFFESLILSLNYLSHRREGR